MYNHITDYIKSLYPGKNFIPLHEPLFTGREKEYVCNAIDSTYVSSVGKYVDKFEDMICEYTGSKYAIAAVNGTAALHMGLIAAGVKRNDLVLTQSLSFIATCNAISYLGAEPVFIDVDSRTLGLSADSLKLFLENETEQKNNTCLHKLTGKRIPACVPMHTFGHPIEVNKIFEICNKHNILLIEDAAESIGSYYQDKHTGTIGLLGAFSFNGNKTITCGGGGVITTNDERIAKLCKHLTTQAKVPHKWEFNHDHIGYNYRLPNLNAALACAQMEQLDYFISNKRELAALYSVFFKDIPNIQFFTEPEGAKSNYWLNTLLFENRISRDEFLAFSNNNGVMTRPSWTLMHKLSMFKHCLKGKLDISENIESRLVNIPSSVRLSNE